MLKNVRSAVFSGRLSVSSVTVKLSQRYLSSAAGETKTEAKTEATTTTTTTTATTTDDKTKATTATKTEANTETKTPATADHGSIHHLHSAGIIQKPVHSALSHLGFHKLTPVQEKSIHPVLTKDADFITKAKTGTGKTLAFGIPLIEKALRIGNSRDQRVVGIVVAPTRDLAFQIRDELNKIVRYKEMVRHTKNLLSVQTVVGGESRWKQVRAFTSRDPHPSIVVSTPGRLLDLLKEPEVLGAFGHIRALVLDEADRLLGEGFKEDLVEISDTLKDNLVDDKHQFKTMLYSATWDKDVQEFSKRILRPEFHYIDTVDPNAADTHEKINQSLILTNDIFESYTSAITFIESEAKANRKFKGIVFLPTVKAVSYFYELLYTRFKFQKIRSPVNQLHGQLAQASRDRAVREFRKGFNGVLVCSDVGARGMDFPNVTNVVQIGLPMDETNYVHRVGRTARGGKDGSAVMILSDAESKFLRVLKKRNINIASKFEYEKDEELESEIANVSKAARHKYSLDLVIESLAGFSKGISNVYRLNMYDILEDYTTAYGKFFQDADKKPHVTASFAQRVLHLNRRDSNKFFDLGSSANDFQDEKPKRRESSDRGYGDRRGYRGNDRGGDRGGYRGNDRGGNRDHRGGNRDYRGSNRDYRGSRGDKTSHDRGDGFRSDRRGKFKFD